MIYSKVLHTVYIKTIYTFIYTHYGTLETVPVKIKTGVISERVQQFTFVLSNWQPHEPVLFFSSESGGSGKVEGVVVSVEVSWSLVSV